MGGLRHLRVLGILNKSMPTWKGIIMTLVVKYPSKKVLKEEIGKSLRYIETSMFGPEYRQDGMLTVANRPHITGMGREFFANVYMENGIIKKVT
jgi:hypothetical protein